MITQDEIAKCWRPEDVITLIAQKRQQLKRQISKCFMVTDSLATSEKEGKKILSNIIDDVLGVEGEK